MPNPEHNKPIPRSAPAHDVVGDGDEIRIEYERERRTAIEDLRDLLISLKGIIDIDKFEDFLQRWNELKFIIGNHRVVTMEQEAQNGSRYTLNQKLEELHSNLERATDYAKRKGYIKIKVEGKMQKRFCFLAKELNGALGDLRPLPAANQEGRGTGRF